MIIRKPLSEDLENLIELIQLSLGETKLKKTQETWNYKHVENPFGVSPVLIAEENNRMVGVRAFMQWRWQLNDEVFTAYRAVDTSTHPDFQGKGIFKMLTMKALEVIGDLGACFVFNTPNEKSRPGYLKMGWTVIGKIKLSIIPTVLYLPLVLFYKKRNNDISEIELEKRCIEHNSLLKTQNVFFTPKSANYLRWRYENNPLQEYIIVSDASFYVVMYIKKHKYFNELRVVEFIGESNFKTKLAIRSTIIKNASINFCFLISIADKKLFTFKLYGTFGPKLTLRTVNCSESFRDKSSSINNWCYSLGDLELF